MQLITQEIKHYLVKLAKESEGLRLEAYKCPAGVWTIGYGDTKNVKPGMKITESEAENRLVHRLQEFWDVAQILSPSLLPYPAKSAAIIDFCYNCGIGNYKVSSLRRAVDVSDWTEASKAVLKWNKAHVNGKLVELKGLTIRRKKESALLLL